MGLQGRPTIMEQSVVLSEGESIEPEQIPRYCRERLSVFKVPDRIEVRPLCRTPPKVLSIGGHWRRSMHAEAVGPSRPVCGEMPVSRS
jgi:hypothetical protein